MLQAATAGLRCGLAGMNLAESLLKYATVVADTGDIEAITRSLSLLYHAPQMPGVPASVE